MIPAEPRTASFGAIAAEVRTLATQHTALVLAIFVGLAAVSWVETRYLWVETNYLNQSAVVATLATWIAWPIAILRFEQAAERPRATGLTLTMALRYLGMAILTTFGIALGLILLIVPGIYWATCWLIAPQLVVAEGQGVRDAMSESWRLTRPSRGVLTGAMLLPWAAGIALVLSVELLRPWAGTGWDGAFEVFDAAIAGAMSVASLLVAHACYRVIVPSLDAVSNVFD